MVNGQSYNKNGKSDLTKLCSFCLVNELGVYEDDKSNEYHESSLDDSNSQNFKGSDNSFLSSTSIKTHLLPEANKKLRKLNTPLIKYALEEFKCIFGTVGERVLSSDLLESHGDLLKDHDEKLLHRKTFFEDTSSQVVVVSIYAVLEGFKIIVSEPEILKAHNFEIEFSQCFTRREIAYMDLDNFEVLKKVAINMIEERIVFNKTEFGEYKIDLLTTEDLERRAKEEQEDDDPDSDIDDEQENSQKQTEGGLKSDGVKTIIEEGSDPHSDSNNQ